MLQKWTQLNLGWGGQKRIMTFKSLETLHRTNQNLQDPVKLRAVYLQLQFLPPNSHLEPLQNYPQLSSVSEDKKAIWNHDLDFPNFMFCMTTGNLGKTPPSFYIKRAKRRGDKRQGIFSGLLYVYICWAWLEVGWHWKSPQKCLVPKGMRWGRCDR